MGFGREEEKGQIIAAGGERGVGGVFVGLGWIVWGWGVRGVVVVIGFAG